MIIDIALILFFVALNGFFVASEFAIVKVRESQIELKAKNGFALAKWGRILVKNLDAYLSACQLGITLSSLALGWLGEPVVDRYLHQFLAYMQLDFPESLLNTLSFAIAFSLITFLHIVFGELVPKAIAIRKSEWTTYSVSLPLIAFYYVFYPFIVTMNGIALWILKLIGIPHQGEGEIHTSEELQVLAQKSQQMGELEHEKYELVKNALEFDQRTAGQLMVSRKQIEAVDLDQPESVVIEQILASSYTRVVCYRGNIDRICGIIHQKDLLKQLYLAQPIHLDSMLYQPLFVSAERNLDELLSDFKKHRVHLCIVVDEYGGTQGLLSLEDVLEELVGDILDEDDHEETPCVVEIADKTYRVQSDQARHFINEYLPRPFPENDRYHTLSGVILAECGFIPPVGHMLEVHDYKVTIEKIEGKRIVQVQLEDLLDL